MKMNPIWTPTAENVNQTQIVRWMRELGRSVDVENPRSAVSELLDWSCQEPAAFWDAVMKDLGVVWSTPYEQILETSRGVEWADWFVGGRTNLVLNCVDLPATEIPDRLALVGEEEDGTVRQWTFAEVAEEIDR